MATKTLTENINQAISDLNSVKQALIDKGVEIPSGTKTSEYGAKISEIQSGGGGLDTSNVTDFYYFCYKGRLADSVDSIDTRNGTSFRYMFYENKDLISFNKLNTSKGTDFTGMFFRCSSLISVPNLDTENGTNFLQMFNGCSSLETIGGLNTHNATSFSDMFNGCSSLTSFPELDVPNVTNFEEAFRYCENATGKITLNSKKGTNFYYAFGDCKKITEIDVDMTSGIDCRSAFNGCSTLEKATLTGGTASNWQTNNLFYNCKNLKTLNLKMSTAPIYVGTSFQSSWLSGCTALTDITVDGTIKIMSNNFSVSTCTKLTVDSLMNIINALSDNISEATTYKVTLGTYNLTKLTAEQKQIAIDKNYTLA